MVGMGWLETGLEPHGLDSRVVEQEGIGRRVGTEGMVTERKRAELKGWSWALSGLKGSDAIG